MSKEPSPEEKESISQFGKLLAGLSRSGVDYAVAGGLAVIFNGYDRLTLDADILIERSPENCDKLLRYLAGWGEGCARELVTSDFTPEEGCVRVTEDFDLDIFTQMRGLSLDDFRPRLRELVIDGVAIKYLAPKDLVRLKEDSWREKDKLDVLAMKEIIRREG